MTGICLRCGALIAFRDKSDRMAGIDHALDVHRGELKSPGVVFVNLAQYERILLGSVVPWPVARS